MDNIHVGILLPQMNRLEENLKKREGLANIYEKQFEDCKEISLPKTMPGVCHVRHLFPVWLNNGQRDQVTIALQKAGIGVVVHYRAIHLLSFFRKNFKLKPGDFPVTEDIGNRTLFLPFYPAMCKEDVEFVSKVLKQVVRENCE